jgi:hypothetical protein
MKRSSLVSSLIRSSIRSSIFAVAVAHDFSHFQKGRQNCRHHLRHGFSRLKNGDADFKRHGRERKAAAIGCGLRQTVDWPGASYPGFAPGFLGANLVVTDARSLRDGCPEFAHRPRCCDPQACAVCSIFIIIIIPSLPPNSPHGLMAATLADSVAYKVTPSLFIQRWFSVRDHSDLAGSRLREILLRAHPQRC